MTSRVLQKGTLQVQVDPQEEPEETLQRDIKRDQDTETVEMV